MQTDACTALDWVTGLFFQSGRLLGLIMQAIATVIGADLGGFADEFGACFEESLFTFFHDVPPYITDKFLFLMLSWNELSCVVPEYAGRTKQKMS